MSWIATAIVGSAVIGGVASNRASKRAAEGQTKALGATTVASDQARRDITSLFAKAKESRAKGFGEALETIAGSPAKIIEPFQRGNVLAQEQVVRGLPQIQKAILGLPTDLTGFKPRTVGTPESFNFDLTGIRPPPETPDVTAQPGVVPTGSNFLAGDGIRDRLRRRGPRRFER